MADKQQELDDALKAFEAAVPERRAQGQAAIAEADADTEDDDA